MKTKTVFFLFFCFTFLPGCQNKFDGTSENNFKNSRKKVEDNLIKSESTKRNIGRIRIDRQIKKLPNN